MKTARNRQTQPIPHHLRRRFPPHSMPRDEKIDKISII
jgi:hypothetical protein